MVRRLKEMIPLQRREDPLLGRMEASLTTACSHMAGELAAMKTWAVTRRREFALTFLPKCFSSDDKRTLLSGAIGGQFLFDDDTLRSLDETATKKASQKAMDRVAQYGPHTPYRQDLR